MDYKDQLSEYLLQIKAIKLEPTNPFTWASGWKSPIYCDNRVTLSYPRIRDFIRVRFVSVIKKEFPGVDLIAGVATGAIAQGVLVAQELALPYVYVRPKPKEHGLGNQVEGHVTPGQQVVVIEDLISTGKSSLNAVKALRESGVDVLGMVAIFTYGFDVAEENFRNENCVLHTLGDYHNLVQMAMKKGYIQAEYLETLNAWRANPGAWEGTDFS